MRVHRTEHARHFTVLPNSVLQCRRLSFTARGLLADLLSRPDGWRENAQHMADTSPQGRSAVRKALKELTEAGFYRVEKIRMPDGTIRSEAHVYDTPQLALPGVTRPASGGATTGGPDVPVVKNLVKEPTHPADGQQTADEAGGEPGGREGENREIEQAPPIPDAQTRRAVATLFRVIRCEPRLHLGEAEARSLAPLVAQWLARGATPADLAAALLPGLPAQLHAPAAMLRNRLERKMPPAVGPAQPLTARYAECAKCHDPVPQPGICRACAGLVPRQIAVGGGEAVTRNGAARARVALRAAKTMGLQVSALATG
ncbi:hypothetical protein [Kitasatospora viridis]|uniref:Helix-turn-helix protein n=1 Tax=Kitasatospora viridis TaxID=281105 RepID=A0A561UGW0_9ACTN|nr:hypothetical protein [Kitasatospora viridis]TWF98597.1 hypothetical protein FHX73_112418 [Kitasatospora viridis]